MIIIAVVVFATTAFGGIVLASHVLRDVYAPWMLSLGHALLGATGISILGTALSRVPSNNTLMLSVVLFGMTAMGGLTLASFHLRKKLPPKGAVLTHATGAISGFLVLISLVLLR